jgi:hypothetical protein
LSAQWSWAVTATDGAANTARHLGPDYKSAHARPAALARLLWYCYQQHETARH